MLVGTGTNVPLRTQDLVQVEEHVPNQDHASKFKVIAWDHSTHP